MGDQWCVDDYNGWAKGPLAEANRDRIQAIIDSGKVGKAKWSYIRR